MDSPSSIFAPGAGETIQEHQHFSSAVRIGNRVETSGQGGWNDALEIPTAVDDEIAAAFRNIGRILTKAGATWDHVVHINTYHVGGFPPIVNDTVVKLFRRYMLNHAPVWAQLGVEALDLPTMRFEIHVTAIIP